MKSHQIKYKRKAWKYTVTTDETVDACQLVILAE